MSNMPDAQYNLTLLEACEQLSKSKKTVSRYIRKGVLHPKQIKSRQGTLEYRFSQVDIDQLKRRLKEEERARAIGQTEQTRQNRQGEKTEETGQDSPLEDALQETISLLREQLMSKERQLDTKDRQIEKMQHTISELIERGRESNILIGQLQRQVFLLEHQPQKPQEIIGETTEPQDRTDATDRSDRTDKTPTLTPEQPAQPGKKGFWRRWFGLD